MGLVHRGQGGHTTTSLDDKLIVVTVTARIRTILKARSIISAGTLVSVRIRYFNDFILDSSWQPDTLDWSDLHHGEEVGQHALEDNLDGAVKVKDVLHGQIADVVGQRIVTESLEQLDVTQTVTETGWISQSYL